MSMPTGPFTEVRHIGEYNYMQFVTDEWCDFFNMPRGITAVEFMYRSVPAPHSDPPDATGAVAEGTLES